MTDINGGFPSDASPHTEYYDYLSDSDLEDEDYCSEDEEKPHEDDGTNCRPEEGDPELPGGARDSGSQAPPTTASGDLPQPLQDSSEGEDDHQLAPNSAKPPNHYN